MDGGLLAIRKNPDYQQGTGVGSKGKATTKATMYDAPNLSISLFTFYDPKTNPNGVKEYVIHFHAFAYCMGGPDCGKWYEGVAWDYTKSWEDVRGGKVGVSKIIDLSESAPSKDHLEAFDLFNKANGFVPCK